MTGISVKKFQAEYKNKQLRNIKLKKDYEYLTAKQAGELLSVTAQEITTKRGWSISGGCTRATRVALVGVESATVGYTPFMLKTGEEALSRSLQAWVDRGLPLLEALKLDPLVSAGIDADELAGVLAMGDYGVSE